MQTERELSPIRVSMTTSNQIKVCRVLCIFFMMYVHVYPGLDSLRAELTEPLSSILFFVIDLLARASVPALTLISGFLMVNSLQRRSALDINKDRLLTILIPMITWNLIAILLCLLIYKVLGHQVGLYKDMQSLSFLSILALKILALDNHGATAALNFLRDLFVCGLLVKPLVRGVQKGGIGFVVLVWTFGLLVGFAPIVFRRGIPLFFVLGIYFAIRRGHLRFSTSMTIATLLSLIFVSMADYYHVVDEDIYGRHIYLIYSAFKHLVIASSFIIASHLIVSLNWAKIFFKAERNIFLVYLGHSAMFLITMGLWRQLLGTSLENAYLMFFLANPIVFLLAVTLIGPWLDALPRRIQVGLRGRVFSKAGLDTTDTAASRRGDL
jgi:succinoglycan biosynthesis protein ExoH